MRLAAIFLLLVTGLASWARGDASTDAFDAANRAYSEGRYDEAARQFQELIAAQGYSAPLCFNLANAEAKAGHVGLASLNYERARYLDPSDAAIDHNLQLARQQAGLKTNSLRWWQVALRLLTIGQWIGVVDFWLVLIAAAVVAHVVLKRRAPAGVPVWAAKLIKTVLFVAIPCALFSAYLALLAAPLRIEGVAVARQAVLRLSPFDGAEQIGTLPEGELVTVEQQHDHYVWVEGRDSIHGWIARSEIEPVIAGSF